MLSIRFHQVGQLVLQLAKLPQLSELCLQRPLLAASHVVCQPPKVLVRMHLKYMFLHRMQLKHGVNVFVASRAVKGPLRV